MQRSDQSASKDEAVHKATGVVKKVDAKAGTATLAHDPVKSMNWPAMTMTFKVKKTKRRSTSSASARRSSSNSSNEQRNTSSRVPK